MKYFFAFQRARKSSCHFALQGRGAAVSFHRLTQSLNRVIQSGGQIAWISPPATVILSRYDSRESGPTRRVEERWRRGQCFSEQSRGRDHREFRRLERP